jgi:hypothetical protein
VIDLRPPCRAEEHEFEKVTVETEPADDDPTKSYIPLPKAKPVISAGVQRRSGGYLSERQLEDIYDRFYMARRMCGESILGLTYDKIRHKLLDLERKLFDAYGVPTNFDVSIRNDRAIILAKPATRAL